MTAIVNHHGTVGGANGGTTAAVDTTGSNLIVIATCLYTAANGTGLPTDSKSNVWTEVSANAGPAATLTVWYCLNPTVGAGHTFTYSQATVTATE